MANNNIINSHYTKAFVKLNLILSSEKDLRSELDKRPLTAESEVLKLGFRTLYIRMRAVSTTTPVNGGKSRLVMY